MSSNYSLKLEKYKRRYYGLLNGGNCEYSTKTRCGILPTGRCGQVIREDLKMDKKLDGCICNKNTGKCVKKDGIRGLRIMVSQLQEHTSK
jgi:hypothetical protein